ncbi:MAG: ArsR/SmtB family transcription factor [Phycisphaerales bacterium]
MPRATTTSDVFNAVGEGRRRQIIGRLAAVGAMPVGALMADLGLPQPTVSKHLAVLRRVGLVGVSRVGRQRVYRLKAENLKPVHDWVAEFERFWTHQLDRIKQRAEREEQQP